MSDAAPLIAMGLTAPELAMLALVLITAAALAGFAAGLFGIGGGIVIVPALFYAFGLADVPVEIRMHAAVATSLATIVVTSLRAAAAHHRRGAVDLPVAKAWAPWIIGGALLGSLTAQFVSGPLLTLFFALCALFVAIHSAFARAPTKPQPLLAGKGPVQAAAASALGFCSSWLGIGGGIFAVILLSWSGQTMHRAVGTAALFGAMIGGPGALGFMLTGPGVSGLAPFSIGYVNVPAFLAVVLVTAMTAPLGARVAHRLSAPLLKRIFAGLMVVVALRMLGETAYAYTASAAIGAG